MQKTFGQMRAVQSANRLGSFIIPHFSSIGAMLLTVIVVSEVAASVQGGPCLACTAVPARSKCHCTVHTETPEPLLQTDATLGFVPAQNPRITHL